MSIPNPLKLLSALRPRSLVSLAQGQGKRVQRLVWRLEDASVFTAKFAVKAVVKGVRPALVCEYLLPYLPGNVATASAAGLAGWLGGRGSCLLAMNLLLMT